MTTDQNSGSSEELEVVANHVQPCHQCGIACTGTVRFSYLDGRKRVAFELDRPTFWELLEEAVKKALEDGAYDALPAFVRHWNEGGDWMDVWTVIDTAEILALNERLATTDIGREPRNESLLASLRDFALGCSRDRRQLWICET